MINERFLNTEKLLSTSVFKAEGLLLRQPLQERYGQTLALAAIG
jgi:hypothetical protein